MIDWESIEMHVFEPTETPLPHISSHIWLCTSGTSKKKWVALSKNAFLVSAHAVNQHLGITNQDRWLQPLPNHHVGGLSIWARGYLSGSKVIDYPDVTRKKWDVHHFYQTIVAQKITFTSIVPTQLFDLIQAELRSPEQLRGLLIGGGYLSKSLYQKAHELGWPAIPTYGCTECCSQIATAKPNDPGMRLLPHLNVELRTTLHVKGDSLFTAFFDGALYDPRIDGWYDTGDIVELDHNILIPKGRLDEQIKIGGEKVLLGSLKQILDEVAQGKAVTLKAIKDDRLGHILVLVAVDDVDSQSLMKTYNARVPGYAKVRSIHYVEKIERNAMGKIIVSH